MHVVQFCHGLRYVEAGGRSCHLFIIVDMDPDSSSRLISSVMRWGPYLQGMGRGRSGFAKAVLSTTTDELSI